MRLHARRPKRPRTREIARRSRRLVATAQALIEVPSPTGNAGAAADCLARILEADGFTVSTASGGISDRRRRWPFGSTAARPGPRFSSTGTSTQSICRLRRRECEDGLLTGSGASDMKGGIAAAVEALRAIRDSGCLKAGSVLLTAHDLHEAPWGDGRQLDQLIRDGFHGDAVLLPEPLCSVLPVAGKGSATWKVFIRRKGAAVHEVMRPREEPSVIAAAAELVARLGRLESENLRTDLIQSAARPAFSSGRSTRARSSTSILTNRGSREPGAGSPATTTAQWKLIFERGWLSSPPTPAPRFRMRMDEDPRRLRAGNGKRRS